MKITALGFAAAVALGLASFAAPASALPVAPGIAVQSASDVTTVQYRHRHHPHCTTRTIVKRSHHGHRRVVKRVRVCR